MIAVLMVSSLLNIAYLLPVVARGFFLSDASQPTGWAEAKPLVWLPPALTALGCVLLFFYAGTIESFLAPIIAN